MTHSHVMNEPDKRNRLDDMKQGVIGRPLDRVDGPYKGNAHSGQRESVCGAIPFGRAHFDNQRRARPQRAAARAAGNRASRVGSS